MPSPELTRTVSFACTECDDFELTKEYNGAAGTQGEDEFETIGFDTCPACGGEVVRTAESEGADG